MQALIDGDIIRYRCGFAVEHSRYNVYLKGQEGMGPIYVCQYKKDIPWWYKEDPECSIEKETDIEPLENCLQAVKVTIEAILKEVGATSYRIFLTGEGNFREKIAVTSVYKGNRDPLYKPRYYKEIKEYLIKQWKAEVINGMEADDFLGIEQYGDYVATRELCSGGGEGWDRVSVQEGVDTVICSIDKDMDQIPGHHYNFVKKEKYWIDEDVAIRNFYLQLLSGDPVDNIQGIKGMGPRGAEKTLAGCRTEEEYYTKATAAYGVAYGDKGEEVLNEMAQLIWIRREKDKEYVAYNKR